MSEKTKLIGRVAIVPKDSWDSNMQYYRLDLVKYNGGSYLAKEDNMGKIPSSNSSSWLQIAEKGDTGDPAATADVETWLENNITPIVSILSIPNYSNSETYSQNDVVLYTTNNKIYRCRTETTGNAPTNTDYWSEVIVASIIDDSLTLSNAAAPADKVGDLKSAFDAEGVYSSANGTWSQGSYKSEDGQPYNVDIMKRTRIRYSALDYDTQIGLRVIVPSGMKCCIYQYENDQNHTYIKYTGGWKTGTVIMYGDNKKYKVCCAYTDNSDISVDAGAAVQIDAINATDTSLSISGKAADAATVGLRCLRYVRTLTSSDLLDNIHDNGIYIAPTLNLVPDSPTKRSFVLIIFGAVSTRKCALIINDQNNMYIRWHGNSTWDTIWRRFLGADEIDVDNLITKDEIDVDNLITKDEVRSVEYLNNYVRDMPQNAGVANVIRRAYQLIKASFTALNPIPNFGTRIIAKDAEFTGIPYSSVRPENLYIPQCVSFESFFTALKNPNSYIYSRRMNIPGYHGHCYVGSVCSSFVAWCYGIEDTLPTTVSFDTYPGMNKLPSDEQNWQHIQLGDMLNKSNVHIVIVTDIFRNRFGEVAYVELSEETNEGGAKARATIYPRDKITSLINGGYKIYRFESVSDVTYKASAWVNVDDLEKSEPSYNSVIIPRRGYNTNWHEGEAVEIDILEGEGYTGYQLAGGVNYRTIVTGQISGDVISLSDLTAGQYRLRLTGESNSDWTYFDVKKTAGTIYETQPGRRVLVRPYINNGEIASVAFCCNNPNNGGDNLAVRSFHIFTSKEKAQGYATVDAPEAEELYAVNDVWYMRCMYKTSCGLYSGQLTLVDVKDTEAVATEAAYTRSQYIEDYSST